MFKKICVLIAFVFLFGLSVVGCNDATEGWKQIEIPNFGVIKVPQDDWHLVDDNGTYKIVDAQNTVIMSQEGYPQTDFSSVNGACFSSGVTLCEYKGDTGSTLFYSLSIQGWTDASIDKVIELYVYEDIKHDVLENIAKSYYSFS